MRIFHHSGVKRAQNVDKTQKSIYLCHVLHSRIKIFNFRRFLKISNVGQNPRWRPRWQPSWMTSQTPSSATTENVYISCRAHHRLSTKGKIFRKYCHTANTQGRSSINLPSPLYHGGGLTLTVRPSL